MKLLDVTTETNGRSVRLVLAGELDISSARQVEQEIASAEAGHAEVIVLDLRQLDFMDSTGLRVILGADSRAREQGRRLAIVRGPEAVQRIFKITRLDERLDMVDNPSAVLDPA